MDPWEDDYGQREMWRWGQVSGTAKRRDERAGRPGGCMSTIDIHEPEVKCGNCVKEALQSLRARCLQAAEHIMVTP